MVFPNKNNQSTNDDNILKDNFDIYNGLIKKFPDFIVILDLDGKILNVSDTIQIFFGTTDKKELIGKRLSDLLIPEDKETLNHDLRVTLETGFLKMKEYTFQGIYNSSFVGELSLGVIADKKKERRYILGIIRDITNQKSIESDLRENKQMFQLVMDNIPQLISWKDIGSVYLGCNKNFARVAGLDNPSEIIGKTDYELPWKISEAESFFEIDQLVMDTDKPEYHIIEPQLQADGKEAWLDTNKVPLHNINEEVVGLLCTYEDITERIKAEEDLKKSEKKYREAYNRAEFYKDVFAHDVNNILQGILSSVELCRMNLDLKKNKKDLSDLYGVIEDLVRKGANLVSNIRKISSIDDIQNSLRSMEVVKLIKNSIQNIYNSFPKKKIKIKFETTLKAIHAKANDLLQDVFDNILYNAVKHNKNKEIKIEIGITQEMVNNQKLLRIEFMDNAVGIPDSQKNIIFQEGTHDSSSFNRLGLGLSLVKKLIESYHGKIWVEDRVKGKHTQGSTFIILIEEW